MTGIGFGDWVPMTAYVRMMMMVVVVVVVVIMMVVMMMMMMTMTTTTTKMMLLTLTLGPRHRSLLISHRPHTQRAIDHGHREFAVQFRTRKGGEWLTLMRMLWRQSLLLLKMLARG